MSDLIVKEAFDSSGRTVYKVTYSDPSKSLAGCNSTVTPAPAEYIAFWPGPGQDFPAAPATEIMEEHKKAVQDYIDRKTEETSKQSNGGPSARSHRLASATCCSIL